MKYADTEGLPLPTCLTFQERAVFKLLVSGCSSRVIAETMGLSVKTAENHRYNIFRKLHVESVGTLIYKFLTGGYHTLTDAPSLQEQETSTDAVPTEHAHGSD